MSEVELARLRVKDEGPLETDNLLIFVQGSKNTFLRRKIKNFSKHRAKQLFFVVILAKYNFFDVFQKHTTIESKFSFL